MIYGMRIIGESGVYQFDGKSPNITLRDIVTINLRSGNSSKHASREAAWMHDIRITGSDFLYALSSTEWARIGYYPVSSIFDNESKFGLIQILASNSGVAKIYTYHTSNDVKADNFGLWVSENNTKLVDGSTMLKILKVETLSSNTRNWSYTAPAGKKIALVFGGGEQSMDYEEYYPQWSFKGVTFRYLYSRVIDNGRTAQLSFQKNAWERLTRVHKNKNHMSMKSNITVVVVDVTDL